jgi:hypothetical protein
VKLRESIPLEIVLEADEFLADEFVVEDAPDVVFASPSDAPPPLGRVAEVRADPGSVSSSATRGRVPRPGMGVRWERALLRWTAAAAAVVGLLAVARGVVNRVGTARYGGPGGVAQASVEAPLFAASSAAAPSAASESSQARAESSLAGALDTPAPHLEAQAQDEADALAAKRDAQQALEQGKVSVAIEQSRYAVQLDPSDAESWLILGAAYLQRGAFKDARRSFSSCVEQATHGARDECSALLR